jgi:hypothetical protein
VSGYVRPRLTDAQAGLLQLVIEHELNQLPGRTLEAVMLARADRAIVDAFVAREARARVRRERAAARVNRRGLVARVFSRGRS